MKGVAEEFRLYGQSNPRMAGEMELPAFASFVFEWKRGVMRLG